MTLLAPDPIDFDDTWVLLESSLITILQDLGQGFPHDLWISLYTGVYKLCTKPMDPQHSKLYGRLKETLELYVAGVLKGLLAFDNATAHSYTELLVRYRTSFHNYSVGMHYGSNLFRYLDRHWINTNHCETGVSPKDGVYFVHEMSLMVWKERVFEALKERLRHNTMRVINAARERNLSDLDDNEAVKSLLKTYETLGFEKRDRSHLFQTELEDFLVTDTGRYYSRRGSDLLQHMSVPRYLQEVERYLQEEASRCASFVGTYSARRILVAAQEALIKAHSARLVEEARGMLSASPEKRVDLRRLYTLISYLDDGETRGGGGAVENNAMKALEEVVRDHVRNVGLTVVKDLQSKGAMDVSDDDGLRDDLPLGGKPTVTSDDVVAAMLEVYEHYKGLMADSFDSSPGFRTVLDEACKSFVNAVPQASEWLARYAHCLLDKGFKESKVDEDTRQESLDHVGFLFAYIADKDIFHKYYSKLLSKRIIQLTSVSDEAEERMLKNMRKISGFEYTSKLQRMFVDKALSRDLHTGYVEWQEARIRQRQAKLMSEGIDPSIFTFTDEEEHASRLMEDMKVSGGGAASMFGSSGGGGPGTASSAAATAAGTAANAAAGPAAGPTAGATAGAAGAAAGASSSVGGGAFNLTQGSTGSLPLSPPLSPMYNSPKGVSPRTNILPSFAWGKTMLKHLKRRPPAGGIGGGGVGAGGMRSHDGVLLRGAGGSGRSEGGSGGGGWGGGGLLGAGIEGEGGFVYPAGMVQLPMHFEAFTFVLTAGCWPLQSVSSSFKPPAPIEDYVVSFLDFYGEVHSGRKLEWLYHLGHGEMVTHCFDKTYRIYSSTFQMGLLHQFNDGTEIAVDELACGINVSNTEIVRHLFPLIKAGLLRLCGADGVEMRPSSCDDIPPGSRARLNASFSHKRTRVKINIVDHSRQQPLKEAKPSTEIIQDRKMSVQAAICRVMKVRKEASHRDLVVQVQEQLRHLFDVDPPFVKRNIEDLINKDYLHRLEGREAGKEGYKYVA